METTSFWKTGEKSQLARAAGLGVRKITDIIAGRLNVSPKRAQLLEAASVLVCGYDRRIPAAAWLRLEKHPAFGG
jgi:hypothetical protein